METMAVDGGIALNERNKYDRLGVSMNREVVHIWSYH